MKQRQGFVSNSSSSSFVLSKDVYPCIWDLVIAMVTVRDIDRDEVDGRDHGQHDRALERAARKDAECVDAKAVTFPTCNFDTFIWDAGDSWWVQTCNNHPFHALFRDDGAHACTATPCPMQDYDTKDYIEFYLDKDHDFEKV